MCSWCNYSIIACVCVASIQPNGEFASCRFDTTDTCIITCERISKHHGAAVVAHGALVQLCKQELWSSSANTPLVVVEKLGSWRLQSSGKDPVHQAWHDKTHGWRTTETHGVSGNRRCWKNLKKIRHGYEMIWRSWMISLWKRQFPLICSIGIQEAYPPTTLWNHGSLLKDPVGPMPAIHHGHGAHGAHGAHAAGAGYIPGHPPVGGRMFEFLVGKLIFQSAGNGVILLITTLVAPCFKPRGSCYKHWLLRVYPSHLE